MYKKSDLPQILDALKQNAQTHDEKVTLRRRLHDIVQDGSARHTFALVSGD